MSSVYDMTRDELRAYAKQHKIPGYSKLNAPELRELVRKHRAQSNLETMNADHLDELADIQGRPVDIVITADLDDTSVFEQAAQAMHRLLDAFAAPFEPVVYDPWRPSAQAYTDSRTPKRKWHLMRKV